MQDVKSALPALTELYFSHLKKVKPMQHGGNGTTLYRTASYQHNKVLVMKKNIDIYLSQTAASIDTHDAKAAQDHTAQTWRSITQIENRSTPIYDLYMQKYDAIAFLDCLKGVMSYDAAYTKIMEFFENMAEKNLTGEYSLSLRGVADAHMRLKLEYLKHVYDAADRSRRHTLRVQHAENIFTMVDQLEALKESPERPDTFTRLLGAYPTDSAGHFFIITHLLDKSLSDHMSTIANGMTHEMAIRASEMLLRAVGYLHANGYYSLDLAAQTIGVKLNSDGSIDRLALADVYHARHSSSNLFSLANDTTDVGVMSYRSPELIMRSIILFIRQQMLDEHINTHPDAGVSLVDLFGSLPACFHTTTLENQVISDLDDSWACGMLIWQLLQSCDYGVHKLPRELVVHPMVFVDILFSMFGDIAVVAPEWADGIAIWTAITSTSHGDCFGGSSGRNAITWPHSFPEDNKLVPLMRSLLQYNPKKRSRVASVVSNFK